MKVWLTEQVARIIERAGKREVEVSLDLGRTSSVIMRRMLGSLELEKVKGDWVYLWDGKELVKIAIPGEHYYRLRMIDGFPVLEIDGLRMQLVRDFQNPLEYSKKVAYALGVKKGGAVLDTCMGLGYTAIAAAKTGAHVKTIEKDPNVLEIAKANPWSAELFDRKHQIEVVCADAYGEVEKECNKYDFIIHDPPRMSLAGELYSLEFYRRLFCAAKEGGRLFHYTGSPGKKRGIRIERGVMERLREAGWEEARYKERLQGVFATKPIEEE